MNDTWRPTNIGLDTDWNAREQKMYVVLTMRERNTRRKIGLCWTLDLQYDKTFNKDDVVKMVEGIGKMLETNSERMVYPQVLEGETVPMAQWVEWG